MKLQITDRNGIMLQEEELVVEEGDILLCQLLENVSQAKVMDVYEYLKKFFERTNGEIVTPLIYDSNINFKVLKIRKGE